MAGGAFNNIKISGISGCVPPKIIHNRDYAITLGDQTINRIIDLTGVEQMHKTEPEQTAGDLGYIAAKCLLQKKKINTNDIGAVIMVTGSPDYIFPGTSYVIHKRLNLSQDCMCFDINQQCSGFVYGLHIASSIIQTIDQNYVLLIIAEAFKNEDVMKRNKPDNSLAVLSGDAGTSILLEKSDTESKIETDLYSYGKDFKMMIRMGMARGYGLSNDVTEWSDGKERSIYDPYMDGMNTFGFSTRKAPEAIDAFMRKTHTKKEDYDYMLLHQANKMIVDRIVKILSWNPNNVPISINKYGNTSCASIPVTLIELFGENSDNSLKKIIACGFGAGCSWGVTSFEIAPIDIEPMIVSGEYFKEGIVEPF